MILFVSYSHDDDDWVRQLCGALSGEDMNHAIRIDKGIVPGVDWWETILNDIEECACFLCVLTPKFVESIYCRAELDYALDLNKYILPLKLKSGDVPTKITERRIQYDEVKDDINRTKLRIANALGECRERIAMGKHNIPDPRPPRPPCPKPTRKPEQVSEVLLLAEIAAAEGNFSLAEERLSEVIEADPEGKGREARKKLEEIRSDRRRVEAYKTILKMMYRDPGQLEDARALAETFAKNDPGYDPMCIFPELLDLQPAAAPEVAGGKGEADPTVPNGFKRGNILLWSEFLSPPRKTLFSIDPETLAEPRIESELEMTHLELIDPIEHLPLEIRSPLEKWYDQVLAHWLRSRGNDICVCFGDEINTDQVRDVWRLKMRPIDFVKGYLLSMLPRSHASRSRSLVPLEDFLYFPFTFRESFHQCADDFKPDKPIYQPLGVRVLVVSGDGYGILQKRSSEANFSYSNALDVTAAGYIDAKNDNLRGAEAFTRAVDKRGEEVQQFWSIGIDRAMKREMVEETKGTGTLYDRFFKLLQSLPYDAFRCFGIERDLRHNHRNFIGYCQIDVELGGWLGESEFINGEECFPLKDYRPTNPFVNRLVAINLRTSLGKCPAFDKDSKIDRWVHSGLLTTMLTQDLLYHKEITNHVSGFEQEPIPDLKGLG